MTDTLIKVTILLAIVTVAAHLLRRRSAALRHMLWTFGIIAMVAIPLVKALVPYRLRVIPTDAVTVSNDRRDTKKVSDLPQTVTYDASTGESAPARERSDSAFSATIGGGAPIDLGKLLLSAWLVGVLALMGRYAIGLIRVQRIARRATTVTDESWLQLADRAQGALGLREPVDIRRSDAVAMPFACGLVTPVIVLPAIADEWTTERREAVLMHEFAHISRGDLAMNTMSHFARALYWFHPLAWLASYRLRVEGERACDDAVLRSGALASDYAEHLLSIVRSVGQTVPNVALAMARRSDFEGRLLAILEPGVPRGTLTRLRAASLAALFLAAVMPLAAMAPAVPAAPAAVASVALEAPLTVNENMQEPPRPPASPSPSPTPSVEQGKERQSSSEVTAQVSALMEVLTDASVAVRLAAIQSLGQLEDPRALAALSKALKEDTDARVREAAAHALGEIDDRRAVPALLEALRLEKAPNVREQIVHALGEIDDPSAVAGISAVVKDPSVKVRREAVRALGELEDPSAIPALLSMARDEDVEVRKNVASALDNFEDPGATTFETLMAMTKDVHHDVRVNAISALSDLEDMRALNTFVAALKDEHHDVRQHAADAIHNIDGIRTAPTALIDALRDPHKDVRQNVAHALGSIGDIAAVPALRRAVADTDTEVRRAAVEALKDIGGPEAMEALVALLKDSDPEIRRIAAEALGKRR